MTGGGSGGGSGGGKTVSQINAFFAERILLCGCQNYLRRQNAVPFGFFFPRPARQSDGRRLPPPAPPHTYSLVRVTDFLFFLFCNSGTGLSHEKQKQKNQTAKTAKSKDAEKNIKTMAVAPASTDHAAVTVLWTQWIVFFYFIWFLIFWYELIRFFFFTQYIFIYFFFSFYGNGNKAPSSKTTNGVLFMYIYFIF